MLLFVIYYATYAFITKYLQLISASYFRRMRHVDKKLTRFLELLMRTNNHSLYFSFKKLMFSTTAVIAFSVVLSPIHANADNVKETPKGGDIVAGAGSISMPKAGELNVKQNTDRMIIDWKSFNIGESAKVSFKQPDSNSLAVNRVVGNGKNIDPTQILGTLNANGRVMVIDPNGVFFGPGSRVDTAGIAVSTGSISNSDIMDGNENYTFNNFGKGEIVNQGRINVEQAGLAAFVSPVVKNSGVINAKMGNVVMASGEAVTLDLYGDGLVEVAVNGELSDALIENKGKILAEGGMIQISAEAAKNTLDNIINNEGIISAASAYVEGGKIILSGGDHGTVRNAGKIDTRGNNHNGGEVIISGERYLHGGEATPVVTASAHTNNGHGNNLDGVDDNNPGKGKGGPNALKENDGFDEDEKLFADEYSSASIGSIYTGIPKILTGGSDVKINTTGDVVIESGFIKAAGGNIDIQNQGSFYSVANSLRTRGTGAISLNQNQSLAGDAKIQTAIDALYNLGTGLNTITVGAGDYNENVNVDHANVYLKGANASRHGHSALGRLAESTIVPSYTGFYITADNATIDGFKISGGVSGVRVNGADNISIKNNYIQNQFHYSAEGNSYGGFATGDGIFVQNSSNSLISDNYVQHVNDDGIHAVDVHNLTVTKNLIHDNGNGDEGIAISRATGTTKVIGNTIMNARRDAIQLVDVNGTNLVTNNIVFRAQRSGINFVNVTGYSIIDNNQIHYVGQIGIDVVNSDNVLIGDQDSLNGSGNRITNTPIAIKNSNNTNIVIEDNVFSNNGQNIVTN